MALFLNVEFGIDSETNQDVCVQVPDFEGALECCNTLLRSERARNYVREESGNVVVTGMFGSRNIVPDVYRYDIRRCQSEFTLFEHSVEVNRRKHNNYNDRPPINDGADTLVVVVESPHRSEYYNDDLYSPIAAAQGDTGCGIHHHLADIVKLITDDVTDMGSVYRVIIANPIRWQTSLSSLHEKSPWNSPWKELRDAVCRALWNLAAVRCDFLTRLCKYNPSIVVNACTGGSGDDGFNAEVDQFLLCNNVIPDESRRPRTPHPCVWNQERRRIIYSRE